MHLHLRLSGLSITTTLTSGRTQCEVQVWHCWEVGVRRAGGGSSIASGNTTAYLLLWQPAPTTTNVALLLHSHSEHSRCVSVIFPDGCEAGRCRPLPVKATAHSRPQLHTGVLSAYFMVHNPSYTVTGLSRYIIADNLIMIQNMHVYVAAITVN